MALKTKWLLSKTKSCSCTLVGVYRAVGFCKDVAVIFHSPIGCVHVATTMDLGCGFRVIADLGQEKRPPTPLISSHLREKDSIFGGIPRLHQCISYVMDTYKPKCLFIVSSCVAGVIGDDIEQEAEEAENEYGIPVMAMPFAGFLGGEYSDAYYKTVDAIISRFFQKQDHVPGRVLLLGDQMGPDGQYAREVKRILSLFGLDVHWQFPGYVPFDEWKDIPSASLSILLGTAGQPGGMMDVAKRLEEDFDIPTLGDVYPVGWENTCQWIRALGEKLGQKEKGEAIVKAEEKRLNDAISSYVPVTRGKKVVVAIGRGPRWYRPVETLQGLSRLEMNITGVVYFDNLTDEEKKTFDEQIHGAYKDVPIWNAKEGQAIIDEADICLTTNEMFNTKTKQIFIPMIPLTGTEGEICQLRAIYRLLCRNGYKGGVAYVTV